MHFILKISLRNLFRQRRRSVLLGTAIAFGTAILVLANAFAHGISEVLFNEIVAYVAGHASLSFTKGGNVSTQVFPDGARIKAIVNKTLPDVIRMDEAIGVFSRAIGNGKADNVILVGMDPQEEVGSEESEKLQKNFKLIEGSFDALSDTTIEHPLALSEEKAKYLNVKLYDVVRVRFPNIHGQTQSARLTVTAIFKPSNAFMSTPVFLEISDLKKLLGYRSHDIATLYLHIKNPKKNAKRYADSLHAVLVPPLAAIDGTVRCHDATQRVTVLALKTDSLSRVLADSLLRFTAREDTDSLTKDAVVISLQLSSRMGIAPGDTGYFLYKGKFAGESGSFKAVVSAVLDTGCGFDGGVVLVNEKAFYNSFYDIWPALVVPDQQVYRPDTTRAIIAALGGEWMLAKRSKTTKDVMKLYREIAQKGWKAIVVDVGSMYETASMVLNLEYALNMITFVAVLLLFFIILIGVINTLRMTIRERTREIGTIRAIGMQQKDVRNTFLLETGFLTLFSALAGTVGAFLAMFGLSQITIKTDGSPLGMLLVNGHLFFAPTIGAVLFFIALIVGIALVTAFFPARRAARLSAAEALRHFE